MPSAIHQGLLRELHLVAPLGSFKLHLFAFEHSQSHRNKSLRRQTPLARCETINVMTTHSQARILTVERLDGSVIIMFDDGKCALYSSALLHAMFPQAQDLSHLWFEDDQLDD